MVRPTGKVSPGWRVLVNDAREQLSLAVGGVQVTTALHWLALLLVVMLAGRPAMVGARLSTTVTVKVQPLVLPAVSVAVQATVVRPTAKVEPLGGRQTRVRLVRLSVAVTVKVVLVLPQPVGSALTTRLLEQVITGGVVSGAVTATQTENSEVLLAGSVAVALIQ